MRLRKGVYHHMLAEILIARFGSESRLQSTLKWDYRRVSFLVFLYKRN